MTKGYKTMEDWQEELKAREGIVANNVIKGFINQPTKPEIKEPIKKDK